VNRINIYSHPDCLKKDNGPNHPERMERLETILDAIDDLEGIEINTREAPQASIEHIELVHPLNHIDEIFAMIPETGLIGVEKEPYADTLLCPHSKDAILRACGAGIAASDRLILGNQKRSFCAVRPPGHHAETVRANGFCFFNNVAIATRYLQQKHQIDRVAIIDFDVHHGNGTQEIFYHDESVLYGSIHESPLFPGTGLESETGVGNIFNAPIDGGTGGAEFLETLQTKILHNVDSFKPEVILISAGFDAHKRDPLANINLESEDFYTATKQITKIANRHSEGRVISFLEGGYDLLALSQSIKEHLRALYED